MLESYVRFSPEEQRVFDRVHPFIRISFPDDVEDPNEALNAEKASKLLRRFAQHNEAFGVEDVFKVWAVLTAHHIVCRRESSREYWETLAEAEKRHPAGGVGISTQTTQMVTALTEARTTQARDAAAALELAMEALGRIIETTDLDTGEAEISESV
jgi:hypothetical protein